MACHGECDVAVLDAAYPLDPSQTPLLAGSFEQELLVTPVDKGANVLSETAADRTPVLQIRHKLRDSPCCVFRIRTILKVREWLD
jgi:hypothetical protein